MGPREQGSIEASASARPAPHIHTISATPRCPPCRESCTTRSTLPSQYRFTSSNPMPSPAAMTMIANRSMAFRAVSAWMVVNDCRVALKSETRRVFQPFLLLNMR